MAEVLETTTPRRTPQQQRFQRWFLEEFVRQEPGEAPLAWQDAAVCSRQNSMS